MFMLSGLTRVYIDTQKLDLVIPEHLKKLPSIMLELGYDLQKPITDLTVSDFCFEATLSFSGEFYTCVVPWDSVIAITTVDGVGVFYNSEIAKPEQQTKTEQRTKFTLLQGGKN